MLWFLSIMRSSENKARKENPYLCVYPAKPSQGLHRELCLQRGEQWACKQPREENTRWEETGRAGSPAQREWCIPSLPALPAWTSKGVGSRWLPLAVPVVTT